MCYTNAKWSHNAIKISPLWLSMLFGVFVNEESCCYNEIQIIKFQDVLRECV